MVRKILITLVMSLSIVAMMSTNKVYAVDGQPDEKIAIELIKDGTTVTIKHTSGYTFSHAVVEYAFIENGKKISMLGTFEVKNNNVTVASNVYAVKVHQLKLLKNNVYYTYATTNQNIVGSFAGVERQNIVEIETTAVKVVTSKLDYNRYNLHKIYEFYFDFNKEHDELLSIDVNYVVYKTTLWVIKHDYRNVEAHNLAAANTWTIKDYLYNRPNEYYKVLEKNTTSTAGNYVARVAPTAVEANQAINFSGIDNYVVENFAIIKLTYKIDGEFIIADVINDPWSPIDEDLNYIMAFIKSVKKAVNDAVSWWTNNKSMLVKVLIGVAVVLLWGVLSPVFKILWFVIKMFFKGIKGIFDAIVNVLAWVFS